MSAPARPLLSPQQVTTLRLAQAGFTNDQIATRLHVSRNTVGTHMHRAAVQLGAQGRVAVVMRAMQLGLLHPVCHGCTARDAQIRRLSAQLAADHAEVRP